MDVFHIDGAGLADSVFTLALRGLPEITWNVTRIDRDAKAGRFGEPETIPTSRLPPMNDDNIKNLDWRKVDAIMRIPSIMATPILSVIFRWAGVSYRIPVDGNHRLAARVGIGLADFQTFVVPARDETSYRVLMGRL